MGRVLAGICICHVGLSNLREGPHAVAFAHEGSMVKQSLYPYKDDRWHNVRAPPKLRQSRPPATSFWFLIIQITRLKQKLRQLALSAIPIILEITITPFSHGVVVGSLRLRLAKVKHVVFDALH